MTKTANTQQYYPTMRNQDDSLFHDEQIQRYDADTIKNRYGNNWKNFVSNVREITQPDGSIVKEYIIDDPSVLQEIKPSPQTIDSASSTTVSDDEQQSTKNRFAQIKAKFEQKNAVQVMASPSTSSAASSTTTSRQNSRKQIDDLYARHRHPSNDSMPNNETIDSRSSSNRSVDSQNTYHRSQSIGSEQPTVVSYRRYDSVDEADEEVRRIHRQGEEFRRHTQESTPVSSQQEMPVQSRTQYEIVDEEGNPMAVDGVQDLIKMSGVRAREVPQPDGTIVKEYVIDDPQLLSRFHSQQQQQSPMTTYNQQRSNHEDVPPPPPRVPMRQPVLFRQPNSSVNDNLPYNIQQIHVLEPQRRYEYLTATGRRVQFMITNLDSPSGQPMSDSEVRELTNAINTRLLPTSSNTAPQQQLIQQQHQQQLQFLQQQQLQQQQQQQQQQQHQQHMPYNAPKPWQPAVDIVQRPRLGSDNQSYPHNTNTAYQQMQPNLPRSASYGALNQGSYHPQYQQQQQTYREPVNTSNTLRYQQAPNQRVNQQQEAFQTAAQFLPRQPAPSSPPTNANHRPVYYQQSTNYPYQGQQQHGVRILAGNPVQQRTAAVADGHARI